MARIKTQSIDTDAQEVIAAGRWEGETYFLPDRQLDRPLYQKVDKALRALGGKWDRKARGHVFPADMREQLQAALSAGEVVDTKKTMEQFFTPSQVAEKLMLHLHNTAEGRSLEGMQVLEPSAGEGELVQNLLDRGARVTAIELDGDLCQRALSGFEKRWGIEVIGGDFLAFDEGIDDPWADAVAMNPPFGGGADMDHVSHAYKFLKPGGRLVAIMSPHWTFAEGKKAKAFRAFSESIGGQWHPLEDGSFKSSGTGVSSGILVLDKPEA